MCVFAELDGGACEDMRPLGPIEHSTLRVNLPSLVELLETHELLGYLYSRHCINRLVRAISYYTINVKKTAVLTLV